MGPLSGIRVLDLTTMVSGAVAAMMLADQGADVIKLEPVHGEQMRYLGQPHNGLTATFYSCNRNKRSLAVELKKDAGREILWKLIPTADVLLQNFRPGAMTRMGFPEEKIRESNPNIVYVSISGFGEKGPYAGKRVYDPIIQGLSCSADIQSNRKTGRPDMFRIILADKVSALTAAQAVSSALYYRERSGEGQHIRLSMLDATIAFLWPEGMAGLTFAEKEVDVKRTFSSIDLIYDTSDGYITISVISDKEWKGICETLGRQELITDERFQTAQARRANAELRRDIIAAEVGKWNSAELLARLEENDVPCAPLLDRMDLLEHPQVIASETVKRKVVPGFGEVRQAQPAAHFERSPSAMNRPAPQIGEHTSEVLKELGYVDESLNNLVKNKVVRIAE